MQWNTFLTFNGQCEAAFQFYARCFGGRVTLLLKWGESPIANMVPPEFSGKVCHATVEVGNNVLSGADVPSPQYQPPSGFGIQVSIDDPAETERVFEMLSENGTVRMALQQTFWAQRYGEVMDQFGVAWMLNCELPASA